MIEALILFGSHARGDNVKVSDLDIIAVTNGNFERAFEKEELSISFYSRKFLLKISSLGNLFALHLILEARPIYDPDRILETMRSAFVRKGDYSRDIADASMLGWFLIRHANKTENWSLYNKRIAWCVRTILIARSYTAGCPQFSVSGLVNFAKDNCAEWLLARKNAPNFDEQSLFRLAKFLQRFGLGDPGIYDVDDVNAHIEYIFRSGNIVGKNTISSIFGSIYGEYVADASSQNNSFNR